MNWLARNRITQSELDMYRPLGEMVYEEYDDLKDGNKHKKMFFDSFHKPVNKKMMKMMFKYFDKYDKNHNGKLTHREYTNFNNAIETDMNKFLGKGAPEWSRGDRRFFWTMVDAVSNGRWNRGHIRSGRGNVTKRDLRRLHHIMRRVYKEIEESDSSSSDSSDSDSDDAKKPAPRAAAKKASGKKLEVELGDFLI